MITLKPILFLKITRLTVDKTRKNLFFTLWIYTLLVILWGAWVRISHSGDGCGDHWPLCAGEVIPDFKQSKTIVEYFHRIMSGAYGIFVVYLFLKFKNTTTPYFKKLLYGVLILTTSEALIGALLVKLELVSVNDSFLRLLFMSLHQLNSFLLTAVCYLLYKSSDLDKTFKPSSKLILFIIVSVTGAIAALSTTLFPAQSLFQGIINDFQMHSHPFIRLRILHPVLALSVMSYFIYYFYTKNNIRFTLEILAAVFVGLITLVSLSPLALKLSHLLIAHLLWSRFIESTSLTLSSATSSVHLIQKDDINN